MHQATGTGPLPEQTSPDRGTGRWVPDPVRRAHETIQEYLNSLTWRPGRCHFCRYYVPQTIEFAHIEQGTLPGWPLLICREHAAYELTLSRAEAANTGMEFVPDIYRLAYR